MDTDDSIEVVDALLALHSALIRVGARLPPEEQSAFHADLSQVTDVCHTLIERRKAKLQGLLGSIATGGR